MEAKLISDNWTGLIDELAAKTGKSQWEAAIVV